jgi:hypothetical protein
MRWESASSRPSTCWASAGSSTSSTAPSPRAGRAAPATSTSSSTACASTATSRSRAARPCSPLFVSDEHVIARTDLGRELQALAPAFVSRAAGRAFLGYLDAQRRGLTGERHATRTRELSHEHGYDTKYAMHALRIAHQGTELLEHGRIRLPVAEPARSALREVRAGSVRSTRCSTASTRRRPP